MNYRIFFAFAFAVLFSGGVALALPVYANTHALFTVSGFIESLIEKDIISFESADRARALVAMISNIDDGAVKQKTSNIEIETSQLIEYGTRAYNQFEDVRGLILLAKNTSEDSISLTAKRRCQVVYRIYSDSDELVYDSSTQEKCQTDETVSYSLGANSTRMFQITHMQDDYRLSKGVYIFEIEYPEYGSGELEVTIK